MFSYTEPREAVLQYQGLQLGQNGSWKALNIAEGRRQGKSVVARLEGLDDRDDAAALVGAEIGVLRSELPEPETGKYYWTDLEGLTVINRDGTELGIVSYMLETGAHDVMVIGGEQEVLVPFVMNEVVLSVDLEKQQIIVDWDWD